MTVTEIALASLAFTLLSALIVTVWKAATIATAMRSMLESLEKTVNELKTGLAQLAEIPLIKMRLEMLENAVKGEVNRRLIELHNKVNSSDKHRAVTSEQIRNHEKELERVKRASRPDIIAREEDQK